MKNLGTNLTKNSQDIHIEKVQLLKIKEDLNK